MVVKTPVYMDYHATTPVDPRVLQVMLPYFSEQFGNAASRTHVFGWRGLEAVDTARHQVAAAINASPKEIVFTSGATESNNLALTGAADASAGKRNHVVTSAIEHKAVLDVCNHLRLRGFEITVVPVGSSGVVDPEAIRSAITDHTLLVSVMATNNEIGTLQPLTEIGAMAAERGVLFHVDAAQALGRISLDVRRDQIALMSVSAHKFYGPKGVGTLFVRKKAPRVKITEQIHGGGHESGLRSGTLNVPGIVGMGEAAEIAVREMEPESTRIRALRDRLNDELHRQLDQIFVNGSMEHRLSNNLNISFAHVEGESLIMGMRDVAVSSGSACSSASQEPSHVLRAIGVSNELAHSSIRFGLGRLTTEEEVDYVAGRVVETVRRLRDLSPVYQPK